MSTLLNAHIDIARERYLEMLADSPGFDKHKAAQIAIGQADAFIEEYAKRAPVAETPPPRPAKSKGCGACFGSGGKVGAPCANCGGTGRVKS